MSALAGHRREQEIDTWPVVDLDDAAALQPSVVGAKAAAIAAARRAGLPTLGGFVVTTHGTASLGRGGTDAVAAMRESWHRLTDNGRLSVVVRSSSTVEDGSVTSMAGMFTSVLDVRDWPAFRDAVAAVVASARLAPTIEPAPMAVLVQPFVRPRFGGVLFGADPVTGRTDRRVVAAVAGGPDRLVSGEVDGARYTLGRRGRVLETERPVAGLSPRLLRRLARLAATARRAFGVAQDVEWAIDDGRLLLLQSRPITSVVAAAPARGPVFGPGPVAETFPDALATLEEDLWVAPLRRALVEALLLTGATSRRRLERTPLLVSVGGHLAVDLGLLGASPVKRRWIAKLNPVPPARRLRAAWRVGRLRAALPGLVSDVVADVDDQLLDVAALADLTERQLLSLLRRPQALLQSLHGYEILTGLLSGGGYQAGPGGAGVALWALSAGRADGLSDQELVARYPAVLALLGPRIGPAPALPATPPSGARAFDAESDADALAVGREALRMRVRWTHELMARAAWELAGRLTARGDLAEPAELAELTMDELVTAVDGGGVPDDVGVRRRESSAPLPAAFRLTADGTPVALALAGAGASAGTGAGGGRGEGVVHGGDEAPAAGAVLVVRTLDPAYAAILPGLGGLIAETGSVLSHLAILAREYGVPTVVGVTGAVDRFPAGTVVTIDGSTGAIEATKSSGPAATIEIGVAA